ncbi:MAG: phosphoadenylyl-sulfate reductase [Gammaproteobacteria bacterium]|nr:phosphoadenylyl-sulfate reductase [Gammaproteobacteria bacterium]MDH3408067.1 phosphoadenylyl-sulfate reductase [Gammaproteobacteria bacterium]
MHEVSADESRGAALEVCDSSLARLSAEERVAWALDKLPGEHIVSSSFGAQSAVMLHLLTQQKPDIPVVVIDTGYLFPETYQFIDDLADRLQLNLHVFQPRCTAARQEALYGRRWEQGVKGIDSYNRDNKVEPMERALDSLEVGSWFAGVRRAQSSSRSATPFVETSGERWKVHPIADWSDREVHYYLREHGLPYHPLWDKGYVSIGDVHTTRSLADVSSMDQTRFFGLRRECGLHDMDFGRTG